MKKMIKVTQRQRDNAIDALENMMPSIPPGNIYPNLGWWSDNIVGGKPDCGTLACFGGWCAWWPNFREQGIRAGDSGVPISPSDVQLNAGEYLFGTGELFNARATGEGNVTDHEIIMRRLRNLIANSRVVP